MAVRREQVIQAAEKLVARGKIEAAIKEYRKVLTEYPSDSTTLNRVGDLYARIQRFDEAVGLFGQIAENYTRDGFFVKAIAIYKKIIKLDPTRLEVYERLAELYHRQGLINEARTQYQVLADYYVKHDNHASALSIYERLADLEPDNPTPRVKLAELYQEQQLTDKAMAEYRAIAELMIAHGHPEEAAKVFERALDVSSSDLGFIADAVAALRQAGHTGAAARLLTAAVRLNPEAKELARQVAVAEPEPEPEEILEETVREVPEAAAAVAEPEPEEPGAALEEVEEAGEVAVDELASVSPAAGPAVDAALAAAGAAVEEPVESEEIELDLDDVFVLDLDAEETPATLVTPPPDMVEAAAPSVDDVVFRWDEALAEAGVPPAAAASTEGVEIDADLLEQTAAELQPRRVRQVEDLFTEAEVLAKYLLEDKAVERLQEVLRLDPNHLDAMTLLIRIDLDKQRFARVASVANEMAAAAQAQGAVDAWRNMRTRLVNAGFALDGDRVVNVPAPAPDSSEIKLGRLIRDLLDEAKPARRRRPAPPPPAALDRFDEAVAGLAAEAGAPQPEGRPEAAAEAPPPTGETPAGDALEATGVGWLEEVAPAAAGPAVPAGPGDVELAEEEEFFDLAAELEQELSEAEAVAPEDLMGAPREQSLEEIVEGFKRGVAENLSPEDYDTHFNLGIAYREMGLLDEAIGEFQLAAKDPERLVECCSMLGLCFVDKGLPELAVKWYRRGLASPQIGEDDSLGLQYDLGNVYLAMGDLDTAYSTFVEVYGTNSNYRDVVAKLEEITTRGN